VPVAWISRLGADRLGALVRGALEAEGVDLRWVAEDPDAPTGLFYSGGPAAGPRSPTTAAGPRRAA
jgi:sugar/nucleoside kinase (ribokinase family)